jgi:ABC-2 type transport system ATP-binding protein
VIHVRNLAKSFGARLAVDNVAFDVNAGESFGLLGPNGAGKTTTMHLLAGLLHPDGGEIEIAGASDPTRRAVRKNIGLAPQALALYEDLTAEQNVMFFGRLYGLGGAKLDQHASWALDFVGLSERKRELVRTYSGGMARRLNLACALVHNPPVLLLDEPMAGVDPQSRNLLIENIRHLKAHGRTIVYSSHYLSEAETLCDRVAIMDEGHILALDTVEDLVAGYGGPNRVHVELAGPLPEGCGPQPGAVDGRSWDFQSEDPLPYLAALSAKGADFVSVRVEAPGLEAVFLNLTGRRPRDG